MCTACYCKVLEVTHADHGNISTYGDFGTKLSILHNIIMKRVTNLILFVLQRTQSRCSTSRNCRQIKLVRQRRLIKKGRKLSGKERKNLGREWQPSEFRRQQKNRLEEDFLTVKDNYTRSETRRTLNRYVPLFSLIRLFLLFNFSFFAS